MDVLCEFQLIRFCSFAVSWKNGFLGVFLRTKIGQIDRKTENKKKLKSGPQQTAYEDGHCV